MLPRSRLSSVLARLLRGNRKEYLLVVLSLFVISALLTRGVILHLNTQLFTGGIGDATNGFIWLMFADRDLNPFWGHTNLINYPYGQDLNNPIFITWSLLMVPMWVISRLVSPMASLTVMTFLGFISCGLVMYILIRRLTGSWYVAFFAAFAAAFMPYHIFKSSTHLANVFSWVFVAVIASFIAFWRRPTWRRGLLLAISLAAAIYTDGYYVYVGGVLGMALLIALVLTHVITCQPPAVIFDRLKKLCLVAAVTMLLLLPVLLVLLMAGNHIQQGLQNSRSDIKSEIAFYSARPIDFLTPPEGNILTSKTALYDKLQQVHSRRSNNLENTNYIGYIILVLDAAAFIYAVRSIRRSRIAGEALTAMDFTIVVCLIAAPLTLIWMLPPALFGIKMPTGYLGDVTALWRVPARVFVALQPLLVIPAALALNKLLMHFRLTRRQAITITLLATVLLALEFNSNIYSQPFGYKNMPASYTWLYKQKDVRSVAELPLLDQPTEIAGYYAFAQMIHHKPMLNTQISPLPAGFYNSMGDMSNPETLNFLRSRGADIVVDHTTGSCQQHDWGTLLRQEKHTLPPPYMDGVARTMCIYRMRPGQAADTMYPYAENGFQPIDYRDKDIHYWLIFQKGAASIRVVDNQAHPLKDGGMAVLSARLSFVGTAPEKRLNWTVSQSGKKIESGSGIRLTQIKATIDTKLPVQLQVSTDDFFREPVPGELDLGQLEIRKQ